ncbi:hypothetical protein OCS65_29130 (plasmid) [Rhodococcus aetherivorans]|uniref:Uncharacterized protein n=1 Tax=Rhodococcus aetherivorans TaxID=191292 RepID=A0AA46P2P4_9NOCA|nr:hypothetical protein [Rhodococcus aetherivorans]UYF97456.1 hypothetical protein OCS65_29130 [Rhodococcus aetherivorans]
MGNQLGELVGDGAIEDGHDHRCVGTDVGDGEGITDGDRVVVGDDGDPGRVVLGDLQKFRVVGCIEVENIEVALGE